MDYALQDAGEVPKPVVNRVAPRPRKYPFHEMQVGKFFFAPDAKPSTMMSLACSTGKRLGMKLQTRHCYMRQSDGLWVACTEGDPGAQLGVAVYRSA